jgi:1,2-diacylglycerol 3-beta-galactosyltransferase
MKVGAAATAPTMSSNTMDEPNVSAGLEMAASSIPKSRKEKGLHVLFLSSDTGGGHRASAESLANQFQLLFPGTTYDLLDIVEKDGVAPYNSLVSTYKHLSAHPSQWKLVYTVSNSRAFEMLADAHLKLMCERAVRKRIQSYNPDVVISVHPLMTNVPVLSCSKISHITGKHLPIFTVVTDLGSAHCLWFANGVEKMFVGSDQIKKLAMARGKVPVEKIILAGLPIRHDFAIQADLLGVRHSEAGRAYQQRVRRELKLPCTDRKTVLVMGGGEGVGSLSNIVDALYVELALQGIDALVLVVCGRNEKLRHKLATRDWQVVFDRWNGALERNGISSSLMSMSFSDACGNGLVTSGCIESRAGTVTSSIRRMLSSKNLQNAVSTPLPDSDHKRTADSVGEEKKSEVDLNQSIPSDTTIQSPVHDGYESKSLGKVIVTGLGFVTRMAEYMVAADVLVSKAGPGTISEAAAVSLPVMLTSFLPGQEEGNVDYVIDGGFGAYCADTDPIGIGEEVCMWLHDPAKLEMLSNAAKAKGVPNAARDIAQQIGDSTMKWKELNDATHDQSTTELTGHTKIVVSAEEPSR